MVSEGNDRCLYTGPAQVSLECARDVRLSARGETDGANQDLTGVEEQARVCRVERRDHGGGC